MQSDLAADSRINARRLRAVRRGSFPDGSYGMRAMPSRLRTGGNNYRPAFGHPFDFPLENAELERVDQIAYLYPNI